MNHKNYRKNAPHINDRYINKMEEITKHYWKAKDAERESDELTKQALDAVEIVFKEGMTMYKLFKIIASWDESRVQEMLKIAKEIAETSPFAKFEEQENKKPI